MFVCLISCAPIFTLEGGGVNPAMSVDASPSLGLSWVERGTVREEEILPVADLMGHLARMQT